MLLEELEREAESVNKILRALDSARVRFLSRTSPVRYRAVLLIHSGDFEFDADVRKDTLRNNVKNVLFTQLKYELSVDVSTLLVFIDKQVQLRVLVSQQTRTVTSTSIHTYL